MSWEILQKNERNTKGDSLPYLRISKAGITFSKAAEEAWIKGRRFAEILVDKEENKVAFIFLAAKTVNAFCISKTGTRGPSAKITCKNLFNFLGLSESLRLTGDFSEANSRVEAQMPK